MEGSDAILLYAEGAWSHGVDGGVGGVELLGVLVWMERVI